MKKHYAKLVCSIFSKKKTWIFQAIDALCHDFGPLEWQSLFMSFHWTDYYEKEFGKGLKRCFIGFLKPVEENFLKQAKKHSEYIEDMMRVEGKRLVNIDPGILVLERLVLATHKNNVHRIYMGENIFLDLTLIYTGSTFRALPWTFPDYSSPELIQMWNHIRQTLLRTPLCQEA